MRDVRDATVGSLSYGGILSKIIRRGGHPGHHRTALFTGGPEGLYQKWAACVSIHPGYGWVCLRLYAAGGTGWI